MQQITDPRTLQEMALAWRREGRTVGLVPTMGYWHEGHLSLQQWARSRCDILVTSIFVNPTQFGPGEDLENYPSDLTRDSGLAQDCGVDVLFCPLKTAMYTPDHGSWINVPDLTRHLCGRSRPGHFQGVATVVTKLFNLVQPTFAVFGQKDWQQLAVIRKMVRELDMPVRIEGRPIVREADGLAMSSRNVYLGGEERAQAPFIQQGLQLLADLALKGERSSITLGRAVQNFYRANIPLGQLDYLELVDPETIEPVDEITGSALAAVAMRLGKARLIDNILVELP